MSDEKRMSIVQHLAELRGVLTRSAIAIMLGFFVAFAYRDPIFDFLAEPIRAALAEHGIYQFRAIEITETMFVYLKMAVVVGVIFTLPYTFHQLWSFVAPGLHEHEKEAVAPLIFFSTFFFLLGAFFAYMVIIPFVAEYLAELTISNPNVQMDVTVRSAFGFSLTLIFSFGVAFELPLLMFFLSLLGVFTYQRYLRFFRYFVVVSFVVGGILTPPDPISQVLMAVPLNILYLIGIGAAFLSSRRKEQRLQEASEGPRKRLPLRLWGGLSAGLLLLGAGIVGATLWLGRTHDPLRWVPDDARWVVSFRLAPTLGDPPPPERMAAVRALLELEPGAPLAHRVILAGGPEDARLAILVDGCAEAAPPAGTCAGDDLLLGTETWVEVAAEGDSAFSEHPVVRELDTSAPAWIWHRDPGPGWLDLVPGEHGADLVAKDVAVLLDLRDASPFVQLAVRPDDEGTVTTLQNQVDLWRVEDARRHEQKARDREAQKAESALVELLREAADLQDRRFVLVRSGLGDRYREPLRLLDEAEKALRDRIVARLNTLRPREQPAGVEGVSLVDRLGSAGIRGWRTGTADGRLVLRVELSTPAGVEALLGSLPALLETAARGAPAEARAGLGETR